MTRYTKLERRRAEFTSGTGHSSVSRSASPESVASTSAVQQEVPALLSATGANKEDSEPTQAGEERRGKKEQSEPAKLLKRAKLLRLKAKKAKDVSRKQELQRQVQELERRVNTLNGERGAAAGKGGQKAPLGKVQRSKPDSQPEAGVNPWKAMEAERRKVGDARSAARREKREAERVASQRCFACRQMGHSAKECPASLQQESGEQKDHVCCYRCGSTEHSLAKCKRSAPQVGFELPFAICFICKEKGHLASKCNLNQGRGIYPNGGCCKLCQSVDHLAKDCSLRTNAVGVNTISNAALSMGHITTRAGADEDDFHSLSRKRRDIEEEERKGNAKRRKAEAGKKVVSF